MSRRRKRPRLPEGEFPADITSLSHDGRGIARIDNKATFIHGTLPGESVLFRYTQRKRSHDEGQVTQVLKAAAERVEPGCEHYAICGGCSLQHLSSNAQITYKQALLLDNLKQLGKVEPQQVLAPLRNQNPWGYRRKARLGVKHVEKKGKVLVGFRERGSSFLADLSHCPVLHPQVGEKLPEFSALVGQLSIRDRVPQIEVAMDDTQCVLIFRVLDQPNATDRVLLEKFAQQHDYHIYLQPAGPDSVAPLNEGVQLCYGLPQQNVQLKFQPGDFTQVNSEINRQMVERALDLLALDKQDQVLDLFCGVGNFTLPLARHVKHVVGVEGDNALVQRARDNAAYNQLDNATFYTANLYEALEPAAWLQASFNQALLDPPRSGAQQILPILPKLGVERIVYVSCYPGTLARDAGELVHQHGYQLISAGVMDMFPHTAHVESIALFSR
jgi:23S rRNA (uracil1939-C5)-methyltransferase